MEIQFSTVKPKENNNLEVEHTLIANYAVLLFFDKELLTPTINQL